MIKLTNYIKSNTIIPHIPGVLCFCTAEKYPNYLIWLIPAEGEFTVLIKITGFLAAFTSTISLVPQLVQSCRTKSVNDLSIWMLWNFLFSSLFWCVYGAMISSYAVVLTNLIMTVFSIWLLILKIKYD